MTIPLVRAGALAPILRWMREHGRKPEELLRKVDLGWYLENHLLDPIPLRQACTALSLAAKQEGPDLPWRVVGGTGFFELGLLAAIGLQASTPRQIMALVQAGMSAHCTHETFNVSTAGNGDLVIEDGWMMQFDDPEILHFIQQYCTAMVHMVCNLTTCSAPVFRHVNMVPHPQNGFTHLRGALGNHISDSATSVLKIVIPREVADSQIRLDGNKARTLPAFVDFVPLRDGSSVAYSVSLLIRGMLRDGAVDIDRICTAVGMTRRSLQRSLSSEGMTFSKVLDETRHQMARDMMHDKRQSIATVAAALAYKNQSAFSRAFHRWEGTTALKVRNGLEPEQGCWQTNSN